MMTIERGPDSDVYFYSQNRGRYVCQTCSVEKGGTIILESPHAAIAHLNIHRAWKQKVPDKLFADLEAAKEGFVPYKEPKSHGK